MPRIDRTDRARTDAVEIWLYIARDNDRAADGVIDAIDHRLADLARMPMSAEAVPYIGADVRRAPVGNYVIYFRPIDSGILVLRILHGARQPEDLL